MVLNINGLTLSLGEGVDLLPARAASLLGLSEGVVTDLRVLRRSMDARRVRPSRFVYSFCMCPGGQVIGCSA
jgi:hypothetical protein